MLTAEQRQSLEAIMEILAPDSTLYDACVVALMQDEAVDALRVQVAELTRRNLSAIGALQQILDVCAAVESAKEPTP